MLEGHFHARLDNSVAGDALELALHLVGFLADFLSKLARLNGGILGQLDFAFDVNTGLSKQFLSSLLSHMHQFALKSPRLNGSSGSLIELFFHF